MADVHLPPTLPQQFTDMPKRLDLEAGTVLEAVQRLDDRWPGMRDRLCEPGPELRRHINVYVDREPAGLQTSLRPTRAWTSSLRSAGDSGERCRRSRCQRQHGAHARRRGRRRPRMQRAGGAMVASGGPPSANSASARRRRSRPRVRARTAARGGGPASAARCAASARRRAAVRQPCACHSRCSVTTKSRPSRRHWNSGDACRRAQPHVTPCVSRRLDGAPARAVGADRAHRLLDRYAVRLVEGGYGHDPSVPGRSCRVGHEACRTCDEVAHRVGKSVHACRRRRVAAAATAI